VSKITVYDKIMIENLKKKKLWKSKKSYINLHLKDRLQMSKNRSCTEYLIPVGNI